MARKKRCFLMIEPELADRLRAVKLRIGLSEAEQIRHGIRWWLESREWPERRAAQRSAGAFGSETPRSRRSVNKQPGRKPQS